MKRTLALFIIMFLTACAAAATQPVPAVEPTQAPPAALPNPASAYCEEQGNHLEIRTGADGSQSGVCIFPDGSECEEWAYFRGECRPVGSQATPAAAEPTVDPIGDGEAEIASDGCKVYRNTEFGYSFHYPADATIVNNDNPLHGITVTGPVKDNESGPSYMIAHPSDREEYRPPEDADLLQWLTDHYLLAETRLGDTRIAGMAAIHLRHERSPQSYAFDRYYFARDGQLYMLLIGHTAEPENWELYNHFLVSFQFDRETVVVTPDTATLPTPLPIDPADYQGWWTYTHSTYGFSIQLPEDWVVDETTTFDPLMSGHLLRLHPEYSEERESIRLTFRKAGDEVRLWPTGVGQGEFVTQGTLDVAGEPAQRILLVCPGGEVTEIWYHQAEGQPNIVRGSLEFGFIFNTGGYCEAGASLGGKVQRVGEMIIASLQVP